MHDEQMDCASPERPAGMKPRVLRFGLSPQRSSNNSRNNNSCSSSSNSHRQQQLHLATGTPHPAAASSRLGGGFFAPANVAAAAAAAAAAASSQQHRSQTPAPMSTASLARSAAIAAVAEASTSAATADSSACSPPYRKVRALRLFDTPTTPKTILQKSALDKQPTKHNSMQLAAAAAAAYAAATTSASASTSTATATAATVTEAAAAAAAAGSSSSSSSMESEPDESELAMFGRSRLGRLVRPTSAVKPDRPTCALHLHNRQMANVYANVANVNPFTPNSMAMHNKKRSRTTSHRAGVRGEPQTPDSPSLATIVNGAADRSERSAVVARRSVASLFSSYAMTTAAAAAAAASGANGDRQTAVGSRGGVGDGDALIAEDAGGEDDDEMEEDEDAVQAPKRLALQHSNISRYQKEFLELSRIGVGEFGYVFHCLNRLDGCDYAIKKSIKPVAGSIFEKTALNEVWAHAVLGKHDNVVRYYSAWAENNHMVIQNEYCNGGSLQHVLATDYVLSEQELRTLLLHIASGLKYIHSNDLVHMDLKAGNIFISREKDTNGQCCNRATSRVSSSSTSSSSSSSSSSAASTSSGASSAAADATSKAAATGTSGGAASVANRPKRRVNRVKVKGGGGGSTSSSSECMDDGFDEDHVPIVDHLECENNRVTFKIGDLGHVTSVKDPQVEEGDCRYLPAEILGEDYTHLSKADIFSLGITLYEAGGGGKLPKNGDHWHELRNGLVPDLPQLSRDFNDLIKLMMHPDASQRPSSTTIFHHPILNSLESKTKAQLAAELIVQRQQNELLLQKLRESEELIKSYQQQQAGGTPIRLAEPTESPASSASSATDALATTTTATTTMTATTTTADANQVVDAVEPMICTPTVMASVGSDRKLRSAARMSSALQRRRSARGLGARRSSTSNQATTAAANISDGVSEINLFL